MNHVSKNVGGIYETFKSVEQPGDIYEPTPKSIQEHAINFLQKQLFETPYWLLDKNILNKISSPASSELVSNTQSSVLNSLLSSSTAVQDGSYVGSVWKNSCLRSRRPVTELENGLWKELSNPQHAIDPFRRNLQKQYVDDLIIPDESATAIYTSRFTQGLIIFFGTDIKNTDIPSIARGHLTALRTRIVAASNILR